MNVQAITMCQSINGPQSADLSCSGEHSLANYSLTEPNMACTHFGVDFLGLFRAASEECALYFNPFILKLQDC